MKIILAPVATVHNSRKEATDDNWGSITSEIVLAGHIPDEAFAHISGFSHLEIIYFFDQADKDAVVFSGNPRGNKEFPCMGIFAQRKKDRPNAIGLATVELLEHNGRRIKVKDLDAIDGSPVLDMKPVFRQFEPKGSISQPQWVDELMKEYW